MSVGTFIKKEEIKIAHLFEGAEAIIKKEILPAAIGFTNGLKVVTDFDDTDLIGKIIGKGGVFIEDRIRAALPTVINNLQLAQVIIQLNDPNKILASVLKQLQNFPVDAKTAFYIEFSGKLAHVLISDKGKISIADAVLLAQDFYHNEEALQAA